MTTTTPNNAKGVLADQPPSDLRDHFAGLAMQAVMTSAGPTWRDNGWKPVDGMTIMQNNALLAYAAADAMLKARSA